MSTLSSDPSTDCTHEWAATGEPQDRAQVCLKCGVAREIRPSNQNNEQLLVQYEQAIRRHGDLGGSYKEVQQLHARILGAMTAPETSVKLRACGDAVECDMRVIRM